jgi:hypothetical protein
MINVFTIRKWAALLIAGFVPTLLFFVAQQKYNLLYSLAFFMGGLILSMVIGVLLLKNPFSDLIEGRGLLALKVDSTGIIQPFIVGVRGSYVTGKIDGKEVTDAFDRYAVMQFTAPVKNGGIAVPIREGENKGGLHIELSERAYNNARFSFFQYPCLIWNGQIQSFLTKDFLSEFEKNAFAEHGILYLNRKMEELTNVVRDFGRYVIETLKPKGKGILGNWLIWVIIAIIVIVLIALFGKPIIMALKGVGGETTNTLKEFGDNAIITRDAAVQ